MKKEKIKNVSYINLNFGNVMKCRDDSVIPDKMKPVMEKMVKQAKTSGKIYIMNGIEAKCVIEEENHVYEATLYYSGCSMMPLLQTAGALDEKAGRELWRNVRGLYPVFWNGEAPDIKCPKAPYICDLLFPFIRLTPEILIWTGDFTRNFGISVLEMMLQNQK